jgi:phage virion morphogenesis protein
MSLELQPLDDELARLISTLLPAERRKLARSLAQDMRLANAKRIRANIMPDGMPMEPRKPRRRPMRLGDIARARRQLRPTKMFRKATGSLVTRANAGSAELGFTGTAARIMSVHQFGLVDSVSRNAGAPEVAYSERVILGFSDEDRDRMLAKVADHLSR